LQYFGGLSTKSQATFQLADLVGPSPDSASHEVVIDLEKFKWITGKGRAPTAWERYEEVMDIARGKKQSKS
jgi:hypothetical protein